MNENKATGPQAGVKGIVEDVKGKAKEAAGAIAGKDELVARVGHSRTRQRRSGMSPSRKPKLRRLAPKLTPMRPSSAPIRADEDTRSKRRRRCPG